MSGTNQKIKDYIEKIKINRYFMKDKIVFIYNPWKYLNSYKNALDNVRKYYPNSDIFVFFDGFRDDLQEYLEIATKYNCIVSVRDNELGYIHRSDNLETNLPKQLEWIDRVKSACEASESEWVMLLEDDVLIKREIKRWPSKDVGTSREYFRPGGGAIFRREVFLDSLKKANIPQLIRTIPDASWAGDMLLEHIFRNNNIEHEKWVELAEPNHYDTTDHAVFHGYKDLHKFKPIMIAIIIHTLPQEIDQLEQLIIQLKRNSRYLEPGDYLVEVVLNLHLTDWENSRLDQDFFINKFNMLKEITKSWAKTNFEISDGSILGCNDIRRRALRTSKADYIMYLDADNVFSDTFLYHAKEYCKHFATQNQYAILIPQVTRMWDDTWDIITNEQYLDTPANHDNYFSRDPYTLPLSSDVVAYPISTFKFAGWGTCIPTKLRNIIDIPDSLGSYGLDDTFIMTACQILKQKGLDIQQYVLEGEVIIENNKFRNNPYKNYIKTTDNRKEFLDKAERNFREELLKHMQ